MVELNINIPDVSTAANQDEQTTELVAIKNKISSDPATETTLDAINDKTPALVGGKVPVEVGTVTVTGGLTDAQLRDAPVEVDTNLIQPLTDAQLRASAVPVSLPDGSQVNGPSAQSAINVDLLTGAVNGWYDAASFQSGAIQIIAGAGISAGQIIFEQTNDNSNTVGLPLLATEVTAPNLNPVNAAFAVAANANRLFRMSINARYIRVRISTAFTGGTIRAIGFFSEFPFSSTVTNVQQATAANLAVTANIAPGQTVATVNTVTAANLAATGSAPDVGSGAITTTTTTSAISPSFGIAYKVAIPVTAVSGTNPTLDISIEESDDTGNNWFKVYDFPRITATGIFRSPILMFGTGRIRYVQTVGGTSPSFTRSINRQQASCNPNINISQLIDRSVVLNTLNSTTASINVQNARSLQLSINIGAASTPPVLQLQVSDDNGLTWTNVGTTLTSVASSTVTTVINNINAQLARAIVTTAGVTVTAGYVLVKGF